MKDMKDMKDWPIGFRFRYNSPYNKGKNNYNRIVARVGTDTVRYELTPEVYLNLKRKNSELTIVSANNVIYSLSEIDIELPGEFLRKERNKKLSKIGIK